MTKAFTFTYIFFSCVFAFLTPARADNQYLWFSLSDQAQISTDYLSGNPISTVLITEYSCPDYDESFMINNMRLVDTSTGNLIGTFYQDDTGTVHNDGYDVETFHYEEVSNGEGGTVTQAHFGIPWGTADTQAISDGATIRMEIGYLDEASNEFTVLAYAEETYGNLQQDHHTAESYDLLPSTSTPWTPMLFHAVPEPTAFCLVMFGCAAFLLKRRNRRSGTDGTNGTKGR